MLMPMLMLIPVMQPDELRARLNEAHQLLNDCDDRAARDSQTIAAMNDEADELARSMQEQMGALQDMQV
jgi:hypothetical protein